MSGALTTGETTTGGTTTGETTTGGTANVTYAYNQLTGGDRPMTDTSTQTIQQKII